MKRKKRGMRPLEYDYEAAYQNSIEMLDEYFLEQIAKQNRKGLYACKEIYSGGSWRLNCIRSSSGKRIYQRLEGKNAIRKLRTT